MLRAKEALLVLAALEAWKTDSLGVAEKIGISCIKIAQGTLQGLGVDFRKPLMLSLQLALHQIGQIYIAERFLSKHPKKYTLYSIGFDCNFALAKTIKP